MTDGTGLAGHAAAGDAALDIEFIQRTREGQRLADDQLQGFQAKILVELAAVYFDAAGALIQTHTGNRLFAAAGAVEIGSFIVIHENSLLPQNSKASGFWAAWVCVLPAKARRRRRAARPMVVSGIIPLTASSIAFSGRFSIKVP